MNPPADPSPARPPRLRGVIVGLVLLAISSAVCILALEWVVRVCFPFFSPQGRVSFVVTELGIPLGRAGESVRQATPKGDYDTTVRFNSYGLRDSKDLRLSKASDWF